MAVVFPSQTLAISLWGPMEIQRLKQPFRFALTRKGQALLAFLLAQPGVWWPRERLAEIFWPELNSEAARNNLRQVLLQVQRAFGDKQALIPVLVAERNAIRFDPASGHYVDLIEFSAFPVECPPEPTASVCMACIERMEAVAALYRGEFLGEFYLGGCPEFDDWLQLQREALQRRALWLLERLSTCSECQSLPVRAYEFARRFIDLDPWSEAGYRRAMRTSVLAGQRAAALGLYDELCRKLNAELGLQPEEETQTLARVIQSGATVALQVSAEATAPPSRGRAVERRQVTVLHCQFDSDECDDPEVAMARLIAPLERNAALIRSFSGHVSRTNHGGLLAYFGYPKAMEEAALQAVRAALAIAHQDMPGVSVRIGAHTGLMLTGVDPSLPDLLGQVSGLTLRLSALAEAGGVLLSQATHRLVIGYVDSTPCKIRLEGDSKAQKVFRLLGANVAAHRLDSAHNLTPLHGRSEELATLEKAWSAAARGRKRAFLLRGDPGIGKSRLIYELCRKKIGGSRAILNLRCASELRQTPFHPVINLCARRFGFQPGDTPEKHFARLVVAVEQSDSDSDSATVVPLLASLLGLPIAAPYRMPVCTPQQKRERTMAALLEHFNRSASAQPLLLVVEDLHWIDHTSLELLTRLLEGNKSAPALIIMTARPEFVSPWPEKTVSCLTLNPLQDAEIREMVKSSGFELSHEILSSIVRRADGIPLFAEELAKSAVDGAGVGIPSSLQELLAARLDALAEAKGLAQLVTTIGGVISLAMIESLYSDDRLSIISALAQLQSAGLISGTPEVGYEFRHALFKDAAYESQTLADRRATHRRVAQVLEAIFPKIVSTRPEVIARNWAEGNVPENAIVWWAKAARLAHLNDAHKESLSHACAGLDLLSATKEFPQQAECELDLQVCRGMAAYAVEGYASPQAWAAYGRAVELSEEVGATSEAFTALWGLWASTSSHSNWTQALNLAKKLLQMARRSRDPVQKQQAYFAVGNIQFWRGEFEEARDHLCQAMALYKPEHHEALIAGYGENAHITSGAYLSWTLCMLGEPVRALDVGRLAVDTARQVDHPFSLGYALTFHTVLHRMLRLPEETLALADETIALARIHGFPLWEVGATLKRGWARVMLGDLDGLAEMEASVDTVRLLMNGIVVIFLETQADGLRHAGRPSAALLVIDEAMVHGQRLDDHHVEAELFRLRGECHLALKPNDGETAASCFRQAREVARRQKARLPELRAATALVRLANRRDDARFREDADMLRTVRSGFAESDSIPDLIAANAVLDTLPLAQT